MDDGCFFFFNPNVYNSDATAAQVDRRPLYMGGGGVPIKAEQMCWSTLVGCPHWFGFQERWDPRPLCSIFHIGGAEHPPRSTVLGNMLCAASPAPAWEGRQGAEAALVSRGASVPVAPGRSRQCCSPPSADKQHIQSA